MKIYATTELFRDTIDIRIGLHRDSSTYAVAQPMLFKDQHIGLIVDPCISLTREDAQSLMDQLWNCSIRPTEGAGTAGSMLATQHHLDDMRAMTMALLRKLEVQV